MRNGKGKMVWTKGNQVYDGMWKDGCFHGLGTYKTNESEYKGDFRIDKFHGKGLFVWPDGKYYEGDYVDGKK